MLQSIFISAELSTLNKAENIERTILLKGTLRYEGFQFTEVIGSYKGSSEVSFLVDCDNLVDLDKLKKLAFGNYKQDSIGLLSDKGELSLSYYSGTVENLGTLNRIHSKFIESIESYSIIHGDVYTTETI